MTHETDVSQSRTWVRFDIGTATITAHEGLGRGGVGVTARDSLDHSSPYLDRGALALYGR